MKVQNLFIALTTSIFAVSSNPAWSVAAATHSTQDVHKQIPATLTAQVVYPTDRAIRTCPSRTSPQRGAISLEQARAYFICRYETFTGTLGQISASYNYINDLKLQIAGARPPTSADLALGYQEEIDLKQPVYPIKFKYSDAACRGYNLSYPNPATDGKCLVRDEVKGVGICFRSNFGEWHCKMQRPSSTPMRWAAPRG